MKRMKALLFGLMLTVGIVFGGHSLAKANGDSCCTGGACCVIGAECCEAR